MSRCRAPAGLLAVVALLAFVAWPSLAMGSVNTFYEDVSGRYENPCGGEAILITGTAKLTGWIWTDANGGYHAAAHYNLQDVSGVGETTGATYRLTGTSENTTLDVGAGVFINTATYNFVGEGQAQGWMLRSSFLLVRNANGFDPAFRSIDTEIVCR